MSTRSAVGRPDGDKFKGRYMHSDGYPTYMGRILWRLVKRDGVDRVLSVLVDEHYGWSALQPDIAELQQYQRGPGFELVPVELVPGYGVAYTTATGDISGGGVAADDYITECDLFVEWAYVLNEHGMTICTAYDTHREGSTLFWAGGYQAPIFSTCPVVAIAWDDPEPDWLEVEGMGNKASKRASKLAARELAAAK